jgi:hypothetical protein
MSTLSILCKLVDLLKKYIFRFESVQKIIKSDFEQFLSDLDKIRLKISWVEPVWVRFDSIKLVRFETRLESDTNSFFSSNSARLEFVSSFVRLVRFSSFLTWNSTQEFDMIFFPSIYSLFFMYTLIWDYF